MSTSSIPLFSSSPSPFLPCRSGKLPAEMSTSITVKPSCSNAKRRGRIQSLFSCTIATVRDAMLAQPPLSFSFLLLFFAVCVRARTQVGGGVCVCACACECVSV
mmetsp:Transcript_49166/g.126903  ORF Transcript_49166/g.126903 Transcript_49166/m.126903 type:complete len:104 (+) Transcript_49166:395-706(+)